MTSTFIFSKIKVRNITDKLRSFYETKMVILPALVVESDIFFP